MSSGFVSEVDLEAARKKRQEEWERVRTAEEPEEVPEEPYDSRSLFDRLEANKKAKQEEWDEAHKLKNQVRGIDDDEAAFLDTVDAVKTDLEVKRIREEKQELEAYRKEKEKMLELEQEERRKKEAIVVKANKNKETNKNQAKLLKGALVVVAKRPNTNSIECEKSQAKKAKTTVLPKGALAGLGDYSSTDEEDVEDERT